MSEREPDIAERLDAHMGKANMADVLQDCRIGAREIRRLREALDEEQKRRHEWGEKFNMATSRCAELEKAGERILPYLRWTISDESPGHHPTMPSAVAAFTATLQGQDNG